jgi:hypothetical protein
MLHLEYPHSPIVLPIVLPTGLDQLSSAPFAQFTNPIEAHQHGEPLLKAFEPLYNAAGTRAFEGSDAGYHVA